MSDGSSLVECSIYVVGVNRSREASSGEAVFADEVLVNKLPSSCAVYECLGVNGYSGGFVE